MTSVDSVSLDGLVSSLYPTTTGTSSTSSSTGALPTGTESVLGPAAEFIASNDTSTDLSSLFADAVSAQSANAQAVASLSSLGTSGTADSTGILNASDPNDLINAGLTYALMGQGGAWVTQTAAEVVGSQLDVTA